MANHENIKKMKSYIDQVKTAMMATNWEGDAIRSRPMATLEVEDDGTIYFFTKDDSAKVDEIQEERELNLAYVDEDKGIWLSVSGRGSISHNRSKINELWNPSQKAWFPEGKDDPELAILKVKPHSAEYWDATSSTVRFLFNMAEAIVKGKTYSEVAPSENKKISM